MVLKMIRALSAVAMLGLGLSTAHAAPILLGSIEHDYGQAAGQSTPTSLLPANGPVWCDTLNANSVTVRTNANWRAIDPVNRPAGTYCQPFADQFNFSTLNYDSVTSLVLTLEFADSNATLEQWRVRSASNLISAPQATASTNMTRVGSGGTTQSFTIDINTVGATLFNQILSSESYYLWFQQSGALGSQNFTLFNARLDVFGTVSDPVPLPVPGSLALAGLALLGLRQARRRAEA